MLLTPNNRTLNRKDSIYLEDLSIGHSGSKTIFYVSDNPLTDVDIKIKSGGDFKLFKTDNNKVVDVEKLELNDLIEHQSNGKYIYPINVLVFSSNEGYNSSEMKMSFDGVTYKIKLEVDIFGLDENLVVALQNMKVFLDDDWVRAFYDTENDANSRDFIKYNKKLREYLLNIADLETMKGTYKNLQTALNFFGYGDLLDIKEHWYNQENSDYKYTSVRNAILSKVDKNLTGYNKTNKMSLVYQVNSQQGYDDDGLPIYINVLDDTQKIMSKLWVLEKILERDFLFLNTHIVNIIGEFQAVVGLEYSFFINKANILSVNLNKDSFGKIEVTGRNPKIQTKSTHNLLLNKNFVLKSNDGVLELSNGVDGKSILESKKNYDVDMVINEQNENDSLEDLELIKSFYSTNCSILYIDFDIDKNTYQYLKYFVLNSDGDVVFSTDKKKFENLAKDSIYFATKNTGYHKLICYIFDYNGGVSVISTDSEIKEVKPKINLSVYDINGRSKGLDQWSTFETFDDNTKSSVVQNLSGNLDINQWDSQNNTPEQIISKYYSNYFDQISTWTKINEFNSIPISKYKDLPVNIHGYTYSTLIFDVVPDVGDNTIGVAYFENDDFEEVSMEWTEGEDLVFWLTEFAGKLNSSNNEKISDFSWTIQKYSNNPLSDISETHYVLVGKCKEKTLPSKYIRTKNTSPIREGYDANVFKNDVRLWSASDASISFKFTPSEGVLSFEVGDKTEDIQSKNFATLSEFRTYLNGFLDGVDGVFLIEDGDITTIYSQQNIKLKHPSIGGLQKDVTRAVDTNKIINVGRGFDLGVGEPVFSHIDRDTLSGVKDPKWTLIRENDNVTITTQKSIFFRTVLTKEGTYTLKFDYEWVDGEIKSEEFQGCFVVTPTD